MNTRQTRKAKKIHKQSKYKRSKNSKTARHTMVKKHRINLKRIDNEIKQQIKLRNIAIEESDLEMKKYSNKILAVLLLQLLSTGTKKAAKMANKYSEKTGIELDEHKLRKQLNKLPNLKNTVSQVRKSYYNPPTGSIAAGWR